MDALAVYVKNPKLRPIKTRLASEIGVELARGFYSLCLECLKEDLKKLESEFKVTICPSNAEDISWARNAFGYSVRAQSNGDLGRRMSCTLNELQKDGFDRVLLMGSDAPSLPLVYIRRCRDLLRPGEVVLGPTKDGGYYLIGTSKRRIDLSGSVIPWSSHETLLKTKTFLMENGISVTQGPAWMDVDEALDLKNLSWEGEVSLSQKQLQSWIKKVESQKIVSVIIPTLNEVTRITPLLENLLTLKPQPEIIVVDGGSQDGTQMAVKNFPVKLIESKTGRAVQLNEGAAYSKAETLLFLHADSRLTQDSYSEMLKTIKETKIGGGSFRFKLDEAEIWCRIVEGLVHWRCRIFKLPYGDQGFFVRREVFEKIGKFKEIPLMEDVEWFSRLKKESHVTVLSAPLITSARRMKKRGWIRSSFLNLGLLLAYFLRIPPERLARFYN